VPEFNEHGVGVIHGHNQRLIMGPLKGCSHGHFPRPGPPAGWADVFHHARLMLSPLGASPYRACQQGLSEINSGTLPNSSVNWGPLTMVWRNAVWTGSIAFPGSKPVTRVEIFAARHEAIAGPVKTIVHGKGGCSR
jgi:hypothetical protein